MTAAVVTPHTEVASYAIGSLDIDEFASFKGHLDKCRHCQRELAWLSRVIHILSTTHADPTIDTCGEEL